jgi:hypothetical protein
MEQRLPEECKSAWKRLVAADTAAYAAQRELFTTCGDFILEMVRAGLIDPKERTTAFRIAGLLKEDQRKALFPDFLSLACEPTYAPTITNARAAILALPKEWVLKHLNPSIARILKSDDDWAYRRLLELCSLLDRDLTLKIAAIAAAHQHPDIREAGTDFLLSEPDGSSKMGI